MTCELNCYWMARLLDKGRVKHDQPEYYFDLLRSRRVVFVGSGLILQDETVDSLVPFSS